MAAHSSTHAATAHAQSVSDTRKQTGWLVKQKTPVRIHRFHLSITDMEVPDTPPGGVKRSNLVLRMFGENFMKIGALKGHQDSTCPPSVFLESWRTWRFLTPFLWCQKIHVGA